MTDAKKQPGESANVGDWEEVTLARKEKPDVRWRGRLLGSVNSRQPGEKQSRWTQLELWTLPSGKWVATAVGCSDRPGEIDIGEVCVIDPTTNGGASAIGDAMTFWTWSWLAKQMADRLGWQVDVVIE